MQQDVKTLPIQDSATVQRELGARDPVLSGRYELEALIGRGGFGAVYKARDRMLNRIVAVKTLSIVQTSSDRAATFLEEARTIARLDHEHIIPVYDVGVDGEIGWIAMRFIEGQPLAGLIRSTGGLNVPVAFDVLSQCALALDAAHRRGVIHRDVKPQNVLVEQRESGPYVWLADFGIATMLSAATTTFEMVIAGTPGYMSPEQVSGRRVDARSDIFGLGCVAIETFTGLRAFEAATFESLVYKLVHDEPAGLSELQRRAGRGVEMVVRRALAKSPEDRYQTARQFADALQSLQSGSVPKQSVVSTLKMLTRKAPADWDGRFAVEASNVAKAYSFRDHVLDHFSLAVPTGGVYALLGRNGSGKTTALRTLLGLYRRDRGDVRVFGRDPQHYGKRIMERVGYVPEGFLGYDNIRVGEYLSFVQGWYRNWDSAYAHTLLAKFDLPLEKKAGALSRGAQTRLSLVGALGHKPELLVLDDPTLGLDAIALEEFFDTVRDVTKRYGTTVLIASHNLFELETVATHLGFMSNGRIVLSETLETLKLRTREVRLTFRDDVPDLTDIHDFKALHVSGRRVSGVVLDTGSGAIEHLRRLEPEDMEIRELTLREIFVNLMK